MEIIPPPAPRRTNRVTVFLTDGAAHILRQRAHESGEPPGAIASRIMESVLPKIGAPVRDGAQ